MELDSVLIAEAIKEAIIEAFSSVNVNEAIREGVFKAFDQVYGSEILNAIADGTREALEQKGRGHA